MPSTQETSEKLRKWELLARTSSVSLMGLPLCSVTEQGSSGGGPSRLTELRDILGSCSALWSAGLGVSQHRSPSECVCICGSVGGAGWGTPRLLDPRPCCSWAHRETLSTKRRL